PANQSGSVFVWDEREAGMRRWTDGKSWSASRVSVPAAPVAKRASGKSPDGSSNGDSEGEGPDGYRYKPDGLMKQSSASPHRATAPPPHQLLLTIKFQQPPATGHDAQLRHIRPPKNMYPESAVNETQTVPAVTRGPMPGSPYSAPGHSMPPSSPYTRGGPVAPMYAVPVYHRLRPTAPHRCIRTIRNIPTSTPASSMHSLNIIHKRTSTIAHRNILTPPKPITQCCAAPCLRRACRARCTRGGSTVHGAFTTRSIYC
ncbi:cAMP-independent regulatory protein pac2, partial [Pyrenophora tritici-repentis]